MTRHRKKLLTSGLLIGGFAFFIFSAVPAFAQSPIQTAPDGNASPEITSSPKVTPPTAGINLTLSPTFLNLTTNPGESIDSQFRIRNNSNFTEYLRIRLAKFETVDGAKPVLSEVSPSDTFVTWVSLPEEEFSVSPNETKTVKFTIAPPQEASLGYYYAFVVERVQEREGTGQSALLAGSPALLTLLEVRSPNAKRELQLLDFKTDKMFYEYLPTNFTLRVKNTGNVHIVPTGNIFIDQGNRKDIAILAANESRGNILPQTEREFTGRWDEGMITMVPKPGHPNQFETKIDFDKPLSMFRIGKYTANLLLVYDNGERDVPLEASISFWVIPWKLIALAVFLVLLPFVVFLTINKMRHTKKK
jgi:hypothetical protein